MAKSKKPAATKRKPAAKKPAKVAQPAPIIAYKGFDKDWKCRGFQYEVGKTYTHDGAVSVCNAGFHACTLPFDVWRYYDFGSPVARVKLGGNIERHNEDSKIVGAEITIEAELNIGQWIKEQVGAVVALCRGAKEAFSTADRANAATTGYRANAATTGYKANAATTGEGANAATTGYKANAATTGEGANAATTGYKANAATTGYRANAATTGNGANAATTGEGANAATTGYKANAATTGNGANAATTGEGANAATTGEGAIAASLGMYAKAKAGKGGAIVLAERNDNGELLNVRATKIGESGTKPGTWYVLKNGEFVEAA